ncbi:hypothetical protein MASR2M18_14430 [Ignavibacteria bacterium]|nr:hypothetical protein [Bacteroidota bacterium]MCZ2132357.1 hypothetical protein [Bacteroidota bacterium]
MHISRQWLWGRIKHETGKIPQELSKENETGVDLTKWLDKRKKKAVLMPPFVGVDLTKWLDKLSVAEKIYI